MKVQRRNYRHSNNKQVTMRSGQAAASNQSRGLFVVLPGK